MNYFVICFDNYRLICDSLIYYMNYSWIDCWGNSDFDYLNNFYFYYVNSFYFCCMMSFVIDYWNSVYSLGLTGNWIQKQILFYWNLIVNSYFGYFGYSIDYIYFVRNFKYFLVRVIYFYNLSYMTIDSLCNLSCSEVVFLSCYYYIYFCLVDFGLFHKLIERFIWFFVFLRFILIVLLFLSTFGNTVSVSSAIITPFFEGWFAFKVWVFFVDI